MRGLFGFPALVLVVDDPEPAPQVEAWRRTSARCSASSNALQCRRCVYADDCAFRIGWPDHPVIERARVPGGGGLS